MATFSMIANLVRAGAHRPAAPAAAMGCLTKGLDLAPIEFSRDGSVGYQPRGDHIGNRPREPRLCGAALSPERLYVRDNNEVDKTTTVSPAISENKVSEYCHGIRSYRRI